MMCPVCKRDLAPTLSICMTCGAMVNDTVREELETKISRTPAPAASNSGGASPQRKAAAPRSKIEAPKPMVPLPAKPLSTRFETGGLPPKKTSKTLVEFQTKKATVRDLLLQVQHSVRQ